MNSEPLPKGCGVALPLLFGGLVALPGLLLILTGLGLLVDIYPELTGGPRWVISVIGLPFFAFGVWIASRAFLQGQAGEDSDFARYVNHFFILSFLVPMAGLFLWGGFGPGERNFQTETSFGSLSITVPGSELEGRIVFGAVGIGVAVLLVLYVRSLLTKGD